MRTMFPIGIKIKKFNHKTNIIAQLQTIFDKEINKFNVPLRKESFDEKIKIKTMKKKDKKDIKDTNIKEKNKSRKK